jgi:hypothetical protein
MRRATTLEQTAATITAVSFYPPTPGSARADGWPKGDHRGSMLGWAINHTLFQAGFRQAVRVFGRNFCAWCA